MCTWIIPVAGLGTRMRPLTLTTPKALLPLVGKTTLERILESLSPFHTLWGTPRQIVLVISPWMRPFEQAFHKACTRVLPNTQCILVEQKEALGSGHALWCARQWFRGRVLVVFGDTLLTFPNTPSALFPPDADGVIYTYPVKDPRQYGVVQTDEQGYVHALIEKPETPISTLAITGVYALRTAERVPPLLERLISNDVREKGEYQWTTVLRWLLKEGFRWKHVPVQTWWDTGNPDLYLQTAHEILKQEGTSIARSAHLKDTIIIEPCYIGENVHITRSIIGPYTVLEANAHIQDAHITNSIIYEGAHIQGIALTNSLIGKNARVRNAFSVLRVSDYSHINVNAQHNSEQPT